MASGKTLSAGTLNLKFMQNAIRSQQIQAVALPKAQVKDDGEWEVSKEVREAWGLKNASGSQSASKEADVHEDSYLPFLFQADDEPSSSKGHKGRRKFGKNGKEVEEKPEDEQSTDQVEDLDNPKARKIHPNPVSISGKTGGFLRGFDQLEKPAGPNAKRKTAKQMVFETASGGPSEHRPSLAESASTESEKAPQSSVLTSSAAPAQFLKPAGVDEPVAAREKKPKRKRETTATPDTTRERPKKTKKQKQAQT